MNDLISITKNISEDLATIGPSKWSIFGGTGFVGRWLAAGLTFSANSLGLPLSLNVVTRDKVIAKRKMQEFFPINLPIPKLITIDEYFKEETKNTEKKFLNFVVFGATPTTNFPKDLRSVVNMFEKLLIRISDAEIPPVVINLSSGAVYKDAFSQKEFLNESEEIQVEEDSVNIYQECKLSIESLLVEKVKTRSIRGVNPRLFSFAGPGFPLESHFAISHFVKSCLEKGVIHIEGHADTTRSYMNPVDLVIWLIRLTRMENEIGTRPIHIGSDQPINMRNLAELVLRIFNGNQISFEQRSVAIPSRYVPSTYISRKLLDVEYHYGLEQTLLRWKEFLSLRRRSREVIWD